MVSNKKTELAANLLALANRVRRLAEPCREIDAEIYVLCVEIPPRLKLHGDEVMWAEGTVILWRGGTVTQGPVFRAGETYPYYTTSLDAVMALLPANHRWFLSGEEVDGAGDVIKPCASVLPFGEHLIPPRDNEAATPVLALCAAVLDALAAEVARTG